VVAIVEHPALDNARPRRPEPITVPEPRESRDAAAG
jgi:hypothetical protein